jgi:lysophosphatidate acyltransferase
MTVIAKRELLFAGSFGIAMFLAGMSFINRKSGSAGHEINELVEDLKQKRIKLWVFPEGTRRNTGEIHQFKKGAFHAAIQAQVPIVPVVFSSYKHFLDTEAKVFDKGEVIVTALPEISTEGLTADDVEELMKQTRDLMIKKYKETSKETRERILYAQEEEE